jgi:hypothetical protein
MFYFFDKVLEIFRYKLKIIPMSRIDNLFDSGSGKLGNLVFFRRLDKTYVRMRPERYRDRKSPAQLAQRQRMQAVNSFLKPFRGLIRITFAPEALGRTALHAAQSYNMRHALAGEYPDIHVDMNKVLLSTGPLPLPVDVSVSAQPDGLLIEWQNGGEAVGDRHYDTLVMMGYSQSAETADYKFTEVYRKEGRYLWKPALPLKENELPVVWIAFRNLVQTEMSRNCIIA